MHKKRMTLDMLYDELSTKAITDIEMEVLYDGKNVVLTPEIAALLAMDNAGRLRPIINTSGQVTEVSAANTLSNISLVKNSLMSNFQFASKADGTLVSGAIPWFPGIPVAITADGTGGVGAAVEVIAAHATQKWDAVFTVQVSVSGLHQLDFIENTAAAGATVPDYNTAPPDVFLVAGFPYVYRLMNVTANKNLGVNAGAAGMFPNNSVMNITPMYRAVGV